MEADELHLLTDRSGLYTADPAERPRKRSRSGGRTQATRPSIGMAGPGGTWGRGGMVTKLAAARLAARSGTDEP